MTKEVAVLTGASNFDENEIKLIKDTICRGASDSELKLFLYQAGKAGLNPLAKQVYAVKRWDSQLRKEVMTIQTSIDGFRLIAERTGDYAGQVGPFWCGSDGEWRDVWVSDKPPVAAKVGALRAGFKEPCWGVARFADYAQKKKDGTLTSMWQNMGVTMIAKCAESLALRKAFPQELSGIYSSDEMSQADTAEANPDLSMAIDRERAEQIHAQALKKIGACDSIESLQKTWSGYAKTLRSFPEDLASDLIQKKDEMKAELSGIPMEIAETTEEKGE